MIPILTLLLLACGSDPSEPVEPVPPGDPVQLSDCADPSCRQRLLLPAFSVDPVGTMASLGGLDPVEQETLVRALADAAPDALEASCQGVRPKTPAWNVCGPLLERPHLIRGRKAPAAQEPEERLAPGPGFHHPPVPSLEEGPKPQAVLDCATSAASEAARNECIFHAAEELARSQRWRATGEILRLCVAAGHFVHGCTHHSIATLLPDVPAADAAAPEDLPQAEQALASLREAVGPDHAALYEDFFWALWTSQAFRNAGAVNGRLLQVLPEPAWPHVRVAAAYQLLRRAGMDAEPDLDAWTARFEAAMADPGTPRPGSRHRSTLWKARDYWPEDLRRAGEHQIPAAFCMGPGRRAVAAEAREDLQLALLEASARLEAPPAPEFYGAVVNSDAPLTVRWTALRLLGALHPTALQGLELDSEEELLLARLREPVRP